MKKIILSILFLGFLFSEAYSQNNFRTRQMGNWNASDTWEEEVLGIWTNTANIPDFNAGTITILTNHIVTVPNGYSVTIDQTYVQAYGVLLVSAGSTLIINDDGTVAGDLVMYNDFAEYGILDVYGVLRVNQGATLSEDIFGSEDQLSSTTATIQNGGVYEHNYVTTPGNIITPGWAAGSTCAIIGYSSISGTPGFLNQSFSNFTYNCTGQSAIVEFAASLTNITGDFKILSTGSSYLRLSTSEGNYSLNIGDSLIVNGSGKFYLATSGANNVVTIGSSFIYSSSGVSYFATQASTSVTINGDYRQTAGTVNLGAAGTGSTTLNLLGNFYFPVGTITRNNTSGSSSFNFSGSTLQTFTGGGTISNAINFTVNTGAILDVGTYALTGTGTFTLAAGGKLNVGSTDASGPLSSTGNIRVTGAKTFSGGSTIEFNGTGAQTLGTSFPSDVNLIVNNGSNVALATNLTITNGRTLTLNNGSFILGGYALTLDGNLSVASGAFRTSNLSNLTIQNTGTITSIPFDSQTSQINNLTLNRSSVSPALSRSIDVKGTLALTDGILVINDRTLTISGTLSSSLGALSGNTGTRLLIYGSGALGSSIPFSGGTTIKTLVMNRQSSGTAAVSGVVLTDTLELSAGELTATLEMSPNSRIVRGNGILVGAPTSSGAFNISYLAGVTTGDEWPIGTLVRDVLVSLSSGTVTLGGDRTVTGDLLLSSGDFAIGANTLTLQDEVIRTSGNLLTTSSSSLTLDAPGGATTLPALSSGLNNLTINRSATIYMGANLTVGGTGSGTLTISAGGLSIGAYTLTVNGAISAASNRIIGGASSNLTFNGGPSTTLNTVLNGLNSLRINRGSNSIALGDTVLVRGDIYLTSGTLASDASSAYLHLNLNTGSVAYNASDAGSFTGLLRAFNTITHTGYTYLASPVSGTSLSDLNNNLATTTYQIYQYNETSRTADDHTSGWEAAGPTVTNNCAGYAAYFNAIKSVDLTGGYTHGLNQTVSVSNTAIDIDPQHDGWNLIGNPYPSSVEWEKVALGSGVDGDIHFWNGSSYTTYTRDGFPDANTRIPAFQGFFIHTNANSTITFGDTARVTTDKSLMKVAATTYTNALKLTLASGGYSDVTHIRLHEAGTVGFDSELDGGKLYNSGNTPTFFTNMTGQWYSINSLPLEFAEIEVPLDMVLGFTGTYTINAEEFGAFGQEYSIVLEDRTLGTFTDLRSINSYEFSASTTDIKNRFFITIRKELVTSNNKFNSSSVSISGTGKNVDVRFKSFSSSNNLDLEVYNIMGQKVAELKGANTSNGQLLVEVANVPEGVYIVKLISEKDTYSQQVFLGN